jgi:hypothetical protein
MSESAKLAVAGLIGATLRRKLNRVIDVEWLLHNEDYAREVMSIARKQGVIELNQYADRMEELFFGNVIAVHSIPVAEESMKKTYVVKDVENEAGIETQYIGTLR